ncbi:hypothetical protein CTAM01_14763 [Colletotrichum tamarilloi]|uniref:Ubiquitin 3 binding protein But2 C-terminal domain-containing protein n=1 Tax=Colletotrichum tamarilloi TaxID=1209934 RepID=A0ABQ9QND5_9PEZI|nr:uncharacterized protein CTAM01_14763 [Colletotrichum tamarilloi]KAI3551998.1 hypothetical protein CSPX01_00674 [Colletotrichum filicis]KAK1479285.1 hypothetical protein CTAM01_14763 [Colletotrichum tamarilloi]
MFSKSKSDTSQYTPLSRTGGGEGSSSSTSLEKRSSSEDDDDHPLLEASENLPGLQAAKHWQLPKLILYFSLALALLSCANIALLPATLSNYAAYPYTDSELNALPYGDARLGLDRAAKILRPPREYLRAWPDRVVRVSRKLKNSVWGNGPQVYVTVEDSTIMRFPVPTAGINACAINWLAPPENSTRIKDLTTKGDVSEIEVWQLIAPSATSKPGSSTNMDELDYDTVSYSALPVRGELLGVLDLTVKPNSTTVEFACPSGAENLVVELKCQRVACHVSFMHLDTMLPRFGFELVRKRE